MIFISHVTRVYGRRHGQCERQTQSAVKMKKIQDAKVNYNYNSDYSRHIAGGGEIPPHKF